MKFRNTMIKSYYRISIEKNEDTTVASNDEQMFSDEKKSPNDQKKIIDEPLKLHDTRLSAVISDAVISSVITSNAIISNAVISDASAPSATASSQTESKKTSQSSSIKRGQSRSRKQSIIQSKNQLNLSIFLLNEIDSSISSSRIPYAESRRKKINDLLNKTFFDVMILTDVFSEIKLFNFRFVDEIKNPKTSAAFEKSRLMIQTFNDRKKK